MKSRHEMAVRTAAAQKTLDRFKDAPFQWGKNDCARLVVFHLRKLGHHPRIARAGSYRTALSARAALRRSGFDTLGAALDSFDLPRITPAAALVGDIVEMEAGDALGALAICMGNGRVLGYHEDAPGAVVMQPLSILSAWGALPR